MKKHVMIAILVVLGLVAAACDSDDAEVTTPTIDASQLTTTTSTSSGGTADPSTTDSSDAGATSTTAAAADEIESWETISRLATDDGEVLYILIAPGDYDDVSFENFLVGLIEDETIVSGVEIFDDRAALDAALKDEGDRTASELQLIEDHHLVSLESGSQVTFQGPMDEYDGFVIGS